MNAAASPLEDDRTGTLRWEIVSDCGSICLTVQRVLPALQISGVEHDLCGLRALMNIHRGDATEPAFFSVDTPQWTIGVCFGESVSAVLEREIRARLTSLGAIIDPDAIEPARPILEYLS